jgi:hypothetical protein
MSDDSRKATHAVTASATNDNGGVPPRPVSVHPVKYINIGEITLGMHATLKTKKTKKERSCCSHQILVALA